MIFLPIVERELRVAARRRATHWVRAGFAFGTIFIGVLVYLSNLNATARGFANSLFGALAFLSLFYCLVSGVRLTADCLSGEKREGTLGLLFLTDLKGYDVIFGKLAATSLSGFYGLLAIFPILAVPLLLGGLTNGEFWRVVLVLVNSFFFSLATGIFVSALSQAARKAMALTFILIFLFTAIFPACAGLIILLTDPPPVPRSQVAELLLLPCPISSVAMSGDVDYRKAMGPFWCSVGLVHGLTWLYLVLASWLVPRCWQEKPADDVKRRWQERWRRWSYGDAGQRQRFRQRLLEVNAFYWLAGRVRIKPAYVWSFLGVAACFWGWGCAKIGIEWFNEGVYFPTAILLNSVLKLWVASAAGRQLGEDRKERALELLLSTRLSVKDILRGQFLALGRQFLGPLVMVIGMEAIFLAASLQRESFHDNPLNPIVWMAGVIMLVADVAALAWVAMWTALTAKSPNRVTGITVVRILVAPWALYIAIMVVVMSIRSLNSLPDPKWWFNVGLWFGLGMLTDAAFGMVAWWQLRTRFRELARQPFVPVSSHLARLFARNKRPAASLPGVSAS